MSSATINDLLQQHSAALQAALHLDSSEARSEVQCLLQAALKVPRAYLLAHPEQVPSASELDEYQSLLNRRLTGEPVAYILGEREFFGLAFKVTPATLIPRPETELLVELALQCIPSPQPLSRLREREERSGGRGVIFRVLDMGTGSGAIALAIAHSRADIEVTACDRSAEALAVARANAQRLNIQNATFMQSDWFSALNGRRFDLIVSNPPYIAAEDTHLKQGDVRFEPVSALASGNDGLSDIRKIIADAQHYLEGEGWLWLEHGYDQAGKVRDLLSAASFVDVHSARDLAGIERVSGGRYKGKY